jgi:hypothetical protein
VLVRPMDWRWYDFFVANINFPSVPSCASMVRV